MHTLIAASSDEQNPSRVSLLTAGDTLRPLKRQLATGKTSEGRAPADLTGEGVAVKFRMVCIDSPEALVIDDEPATIKDAEKGIVEYEWGAGETDHPGRYAAWFVVESGGKVETYPSNGRTEILQFIDGGVDEDGS